MKQQIKFESQELDGLAARADELCEWLNDEESAEGERQEVVNIPVHITVIASTALVYGLPILLDRYLPNAACWGGGCAL